MFKFFVLVTLLVAIVSAGPLLRQWIPEYPSIPDLSGRIINGTETMIEENPHQVSLYIPGYGHVCGGSIISKNWVLTAAHCVSSAIANDYIVLAGTANLKEGGSRHHISEIIPHENFHDINYDVLVNDLAVIRVNESFEFDTKRKPIRLYDVNEETEIGSIAVLTGWGLTSHGYPNILNRVEVPIISKARCNEFYEYVYGLPEGQICAGYEEGGKDACRGDSGGPLTVNGRLAGIVSWGMGCAYPKNPGVYTEIAFFRDWIKKHSGV